MIVMIHSMRNGVAIHGLLLFLIAASFPATATLAQSVDDRTPIATNESAAEPSTPASEFGLTIRSTEAKSPEEERAGFHLPPGFQVQLFASEPQIAKPFNMAFDARGRLWITQTFEYPSPAPAGQEPRDSIQVLEDTDGDGVADKVTQFAAKLNIPIGLIPYGDGVICFSIPDILYLRDTDGDSVCDERIKLLGPFDTSRDTHGMINSLRRGEDGWIYACHGFNNHSVVTASDGSKVDLTSGNTFRFWPDGSRIEQFTQGQVNPFGMTQDPWGDWYSADCHSKPISRLIRGGSYKSFGRPDNGLGFVPDLMNHLHGSTAISGLACYDAPQFPESFRHDFFSGNVMTSRINRNRMVATQEGISAVEQPDFMTSEDSWFRPADIQLGPDGAIYVSDFYNKIIGHYEVPLDHPDRDRFRGRIWRITGPGNERSKPLHAAVLPRHLEANVRSVGASLVAELGSDNATRRRLALQQVCDHDFEAIEPELHNAISVSDSVHRQVNAMWALARGGKLTSAELASVMQSKEPLAQVHAFRCAVAFASLADEALRMTISEDPSGVDPRARLVISQARMEALASSASAASFAELIRTATSYPPGSLLHQAGKICVRRVLEATERRQMLMPAWHSATNSSSADRLLGIDGPHAVYLAEVLATIPSSDLAEGLFQFMKSPRSQDLQKRMLIDYAIKNLNADRLPSLVAYLRDNDAGDLDEQAEWLEQLRSRLKAAGINSFSEVEQWTADVLDGYVQKVQNLLNESDSAILGWHAAPLDAKSVRPGAVASAAQGASWLTENRKARDQQHEHRYFSSLTLGEKYTGRWISDSFAAPSELTFWVAGHHGIPNKPALGLNSIELVDANSGEVLHQAKPPRNDVAKQVTWIVNEHAGRSVRIVVTDGDAGTAYAWIAVGRFSVSGLNPIPMQPLIDRVTGFLADAPLASWQSKIESLMVDDRLDRRSQYRLAESLVRAKRYLALANVLSAANQIQVSAELPSPSQMLERLRLDSSVTNANELAFDFAKILGQNTPSNRHVELAKPLIGTHEGRILLVRLIEAGQLGTRSVAGLDSLLPNEIVSKQHEDSTHAEDTNAVIKLKAWCQAADPSAEVQDEMLRQRIVGMSHASIDLNSGQQLFEKNCQTCHQLSGKGTVIGPQLDGVKTRGLERLAEDVLLPHRNVDIAFRASTLLLEDGTIVAGLVRSLDGSETRVVQSDGQERVIAADEITSRRDSQRSLMPDNFGDLLTDDQLASLLAFLAK